MFFLKSQILEIQMKTISRKTKFNLERRQKSVSFGTDFFFLGGGGGSRAPPNFRSINFNSFVFTTKKKSPKQPLFLDDAPFSLRFYSLLPFKTFLLYHSKSAPSSGGLGLLYPGDGAS